MGRREKADAGCEEERAREMWKTWLYEEGVGAKRTKRAKRTWQICTRRLLIKSVVDQKGQKGLEGDIPNVALIRTC